MIVMRAGFSVLMMMGIAYGMFVFMAPKPAFTFRSVTLLQTQVTPADTMDAPFSFDFDESCGANAKVSIYPQFLRDDEGGGFKGRIIPESRVIENPKAGRGFSVKERLKLLQLVPPLEPGDYFLRFLAVTRCEHSVIPQRTESEMVPFRVVPVSIPVDTE